MKESCANHLDNISYHLVDEPKPAIFILYLLSKRGIPLIVETSSLGGIQATSYNIGRFFYSLLKVKEKHLIEWYFVLNIEFIYGKIWLVFTPSFINLLVLFFYTYDYFLSYISPLGWFVLQDFLWIFSQDILSDLLFRFALDLLIWFLCEESLTIVACIME